MPVDYEKLVQLLKTNKVGSIFNTLGATADTPGGGSAYTTTKHIWHGIIKKMEEAAKEAGVVPILYGIDSIHGANYIDEGTVFPQPINQGAAFNREAAAKIGHWTALETRAAGIPWNFNPVIDVARNPLWSRVFETFGEDTYLVSELGVAYVQGHRANGDLNGVPDLRNRNNTAVCLKHFLGYSATLNGRDRTPAYFSEKDIREIYLPPFTAAVKAGGETVMINSGAVNGIPGHADKHHMTDMLKGELGFEGFTVSDWEDVKRLQLRDRIAETQEEAVRLAVMAGLDMSMVPLDVSFHEHCVNLTKKDAAFTARVDDAARRILNVKEKLGLLDDNAESAVRPADLDMIGTDEAAQLSLEAARESIILAKNENNVLPLSKKNLRMLVTGPNANLRKALNGAWTYTWQGRNEQVYDVVPTRVLSVYQALLQEAAANVSVVFKEGVSLATNEFVNLGETIAEAQKADVVVLVIGEDGYTEGLGDIDTMALPEIQTSLARALAEQNKPIITIYLGGRPRLITEIDSISTAVIIGFLPGNRGGEALADIIFGDANPSGRLPVTYPRTTNHFTTYDLLSIEEFNKNPLYEFGHGLSYTTFNYTDIQLSSQVLDYASSSNPRLNVYVEVTNTGSRPGKETVLLFLRDEYASVMRPVKQLKGFDKIHLEVGETKVVKFELTVGDHLSFVATNNERIAENGKFFIFIGEKKAEFNLINVPKKN